ncbi:MAG: DUF2070 family protein [Promethearchaeota archaeon]|nr:MAG: DUF2070 family protein [Candidatus Lokiarchaeota archaeon]
MFVQKSPSRKAPGIFSYIELLSEKYLAYTIFFTLPFFIGFLSMILHAIYYDCLDFFFCFHTNLQYFLQIFIIFMVTSLIGAFFSLLYAKRAPVLAAPPKGWSIQMNTIFNSIIGGSFLVGQGLAIYLQNFTFQEVFLMLGTIIAYIVAFVLYFSFTTVGKYGHFLLSLIQPISIIILYSIYTAQLSLIFFIRAIIFFSTCALLFTVPYARGIFNVSKIYREATGLGGYPFIRAFVLSMITSGNDDKIEQIFDKVGINSSIKIQYLAIRNKNTKKMKGIFIVPHVHFGPFKTCGSSDLPESIYKLFRNEIPGTTVYHTTTDHSQNLTSQNEVNKVLNRIKTDVNRIKNNQEIQWMEDIKDFTRKISNNSKIIGMEVDNIPILFLTRHPLPSDDIQAEVGNRIREIAQWNKYRDVMIIDSHNSIIGDEVLIEKDSIEGNELVDVAEKFFMSKSREISEHVKLLYGFAVDPVDEYSEFQGIGYGGIVVHIFKNSETNQKTALIHFDANNAYVDIRSYILNMLQNRGIERGEITTSDSHTVARQLTSRGYSPLGDKIKLEFIIKKLEKLIQKADDNLEPVEFYYTDSIIDDIKIWGNPKYFETIMETLQECIRVSQRLLTFSLIVPTFFSLILLLFYYNINITGII